MIPSAGSAPSIEWACPHEVPDALLELLEERLPASAGSTPIVLVDGLSGSGKSTRAAALARALRRPPALRDRDEATADGTTAKSAHRGRSSAVRGSAAAWRVLGPDLWYPGWDGLAAAQPVTLALLGDLRAGRPGVYRPWNWEASEWSDPIEVAPGIPTILEGCGALFPAARALADAALWVEARGGEAARRERALARDGETYRPHWERWAAQDLARLETDHPRDLADAVILV